MHPSTKRVIVFANFIAFCTGFIALVSAFIQTVTGLVTTGGWVMVVHTIMIAAMFLLFVIAQGLSFFFKAIQGSKLLVAKVDWVIMWVPTAGFFAMVYCLHQAVGLPSAFMNQGVATASVVCIIFWVISFSADTLIWRHYWELEYGQVTTE